MSSVAKTAPAVRWLNMELPALSATPPDDEARETGAVVPVLTYVGEDVEERAEEEYCPSCGEGDAFRYLGSFAATLLSVALSNLFGMDELDNSEKKTPGVCGLGAGCGPPGWFYSKTVPAPLPYVPVFTARC